MIAELRQAGEQMWGYYGSKSKIVNKYPEPQFDRIIEPFAGTSRYALKYYAHDITISDKDETIISIWKWLQQISKEDLLSTRTLDNGDSLLNYDWDCKERKYLMGFLIASGVALSQNAVSSHRTKDYQITQLKNISENLYKIKDWEILQCDYTILKNEEATWFIDPPYQHGGHRYRHNNRKINYPNLKKWCDERYGEVIVCENSKATWIPLNPISTLHGSVHDTTECMYYCRKMLELRQAGEP